MGALRTGDGRCSSRGDRDPLTSERRHALASTDGFTVAAWSASPETNPIGVVVLCHGLTTGADDDGPFLPLRDRLLRRGLAVVRFDARCHGDTGGDWMDLSLRGWRDDVLAAMTLARELADAPLLILAASFSGGPAIAAILDGAPDCAGIVLWAPVLDYRRTYLSCEFPAGAEVVATEGNPALPEWASHQLPWVSVPFSKSLVAEMQADSTPERTSELPCPGLVIHGAADPFVPAAISRDVTSGTARLALRQLPVIRHGFSRSPANRPRPQRPLAGAASAGSHALAVPGPCRLCAGRLRLGIRA